MEMECEKFHKNPIVSINGLIESGTQFDVDIVLPEDDKSVIYGVVKDCKGRPVKDAVVKLIEVDCRKEKGARKPVTHTFTNECGEFLFGPLCENKKYDVQIWVNNVKHIKICARPEHERECLQGVFLDKCDFIVASGCNSDCKFIINEHDHKGCDCE